MNELGPVEVLQRLEASGLRGRGGGWFPAARKWRTVLAEGGEPFVVANAGEGEPGSLKDRVVLRDRSAEVVQGLQLACRAVGAREAVVYFKEGLAFLQPQMDAAIGAAAVEGLSIRTVVGADTYVAGEETAILEVLEGRRAWPRPKPPLPAAVGYRGRPTLVQNVETLARVPAAVRDPAAYRTTETTLVSIWGDVRHPGVHEVRLGTPLHEVVERFGGGAPDGILAVFPAGPSAPPLGADDLGVALDPDALRAAGSGLGTAALLVVSARVCPTALAVSLTSFFEREACGQCPPCVVGTANLARFTRSFHDGTGRARDLAFVGETAGFMEMHGYCAHSRTAAGVTRSLLARWTAHVAAHAGASTCPDGLRHLDPFAPGSAARQALEDAVTPPVGAA